MAQVVYPPPPQRRSSIVPALTLALLAGVVGGFLILGLIARRATSGVLNQFATAVTGRPLTITTTAPVVVQRIQQMARLETIVYTMDQTVEGARDNRLLPEILTGDHVLMLVHGQAIAGVDLSQLGADDIVVHGTTVTVKLPQAQIFSTRLDNQNTRVFSRSTGWLVPQDPNLESEVREKAEKQLQDAALSSGILDQARQGARSAVTTLLLGLGFSKIDFA